MHVYMYVCMYGWIEESEPNWGRRDVGRYCLKCMMKRVEKRHFYLEKMCSETDCL